MKQKKLYKCVAFQMVLGERKVRKVKFVRAHSPIQAQIIAFMNETLCDAWSTTAEEVKGA